MNSVFLDKKIKYTGKELAPHWIFRQTGLLGDSIAAFIGPADVSTKNMVDLVDIKNCEPIFSKSMLHFIIEHFETNLELAIARQRLLTAIAFEEIVRLGTKNARREGDDIFVGKGKLSVSIATVSPVSTLIHFAMNITHEGTPVKTSGLNDLGIESKMLAQNILERYTDEIATMHLARSKVRPVLAGPVMNQKG